MHTKASFFLFCLIRESGLPDKILSFVGKFLVDMAEQERQFSRGKSDALTCEQFYDLYSPAVYGDILKTISDTRVAGQVLYEVFIHFFRHRRELNNSPLLPLTQLLNIARKESQKAIQPFRLFKVCGTDTSNPLQKISARQ